MNTKTIIPNIFSINAKSPKVLFMIISKLNYYI